MIKLLHKYKQDLQNASIIISGIVLGKGVAIFLTLFLTRIYSPENFGVLAIFMSGGALFSAVFTLKYEISLLSTPESEQLNFVKFLRTNAFYFAVLAQAICIVLYLTKIIDLIYCFVPMYAFIISIYEIERMRKVFDHNFKIISVSEVVRNSVGSVIPLAKYITGAFPGGLMFGELFSKIAAIIVFGGKELLSFQKFIEWADGLKKEIRNMLKTGGASVINIASSESLILVTGAIYGPHFAGLFFIGRRIVAVPIGLVTTALGDIINSKFSKLYLDENGKWKIRKLVFKSIVVLAILSTIATVLIFISIDFVVDNLLSEEYVDVAKIVKCSMAYYFSLIIIRPISSYFNITKRYKYTLIWDAVRFLILLMFYLIVLSLKLDFYNFVLGLSICLFFGYSLYPIMIKFEKVSVNS